MTRSRKSSGIAISALLAVGSSAYSQQPPDVVTSDTSNNVAMGPGVLESLDHSTGGAFDNTAAGVLALHQNTTGISNSVFGVQAMFANTTGAANVAVGLQALTSNTSGNWNTAIGSEALIGNTIANSNTAVGFNSLLYNSTGSFNTASGLNAPQAVRCISSITVVTCSSRTTTSA